MIDATKSLDWNCYLLITKDLGLGGGGLGSEMLALILTNLIRNSQHFHSLIPNQRHTRGFP